MARNRYRPQDLGNQRDSRGRPYRETIETATQPGTGITAGTGTICKTSIKRDGDRIVTTIFVDLTGLQSSTTDLDIIGTGSGVAYLTQITAAANGTIVGGTMTCYEVPATGADDIDLYAATEGTGVFDGAVGDLAETAVITTGGAWANGTVKPIIADSVAANKYLYLTCGEAGTVGTYTAGRLELILIGYAA